jgi:hypothetical protein
MMEMFIKEKLFVNSMKAYPQQEKSSDQLRSDAMGYLEKHTIDVQRARKTHTEDYLLDCAFKHEGREQIFHINKDIVETLRKKEEKTAVLQKNLLSIDGIVSYLNGR